FRHVQIGQLRDFEPFISAGVDAAERREIHVHVKGKPVVTAAAAHPQAEGGDFALLYVYARRARSSVRLDVMLRKIVDNRLFERVHECPDAETEAGEIEQRV